MKRNCSDVIKRAHEVRQQRLAQVYAKMNILQRHVKALEREISMRAQLAVSDIPVAFSYRDAEKEYQGGSATLSHAAQPVRTVQGRLLPSIFILTS